MHRVARFGDARWLRPSTLWDVAWLDRLIGIADQPSDDDDLRLRKRVGVIAGYVLILAALQLPILGRGLPLSWAVAAALPAINAANLLVFARTKRFDRYVGVLAASILLVSVAVEVALGGLNGSSAAVVFAFLAPVLALLALGPHRATTWFIAFLALLLGVIAIDPIVSSRIEPQPYPLRLLWYGANLAVPLGFTFALLRYTDIRRRRAEARSEELLTNAIPASISARLKRGETRIAETYPATTVLFADLEGFTPWARETDPDDVVAFLDDLFSRFDAIAAEHGVEKIKTIGDAYMAVAGAPEPNAEHASAAIELGRAMLRAVAESRARSSVPLGSPGRPCQRAGRRRRDRRAADPLRSVGRHREHGVADAIGRGPGSDPDRVRRPTSCCTTATPSSGASRSTSRVWDR